VLLSKSEPPLWAAQPDRRSVAPNATHPWMTGPASLVGARPLLQPGRWFGSYQATRCRLSRISLATFDTAEHARPRVDGKSLATVRQNQYSLPVHLAGLRVAARIGAREIVFSHDGKIVARHQRLQERYGVSAQLDHYLELLRVKPGALSRSLALRQEREQGQWPACFDELWRAIEGKVSRSEAARQMVDVLLPCREHDPATAELAVRGALAAGAVDGRAIALLCDRRTRPPAVPIELPDRLAQHERPVPGLGEYDQLLDQDRAVGQ
jgi:hypothetical protein